MTRTTTMRRIALLCAALSVVSLTACAPSITYPPRGDIKLEISDPNTNPAPKVMEVALERITERYPVEGDYVVNLPQGMEQRWAKQLLERIDPEHALIVDPSRTDLPTFHVTRVWVRPGSWAEVDILRPMQGITPAGVPQVYEIVTVRLSRSGLGPWRIDSLRAWPGRVAEAPPLFGWPEAADTQTLLTGANEAANEPE